MVSTALQNWSVPARRRQMVRLEATDRNLLLHASGSATSAPRLVELTDGTLYDEVWNRRALSRRERSFITVAALVAAGNIEQLPWHLRYAVENGISEPEISEAITHLAFYAGWPKAMSAINAAKTVFEDAFPADAAD